jgi:hypothetical protein
MPFKLDPNADIANTSLVEHLEVAPIDVVRALGTPHRRADGYKVSGLYSFLGDTATFTLYDWKSTSLYHQDLPSPLIFWNSRSKVSLSIGSNCDDARAFKAWLFQKIASAA